MTRASAENDGSTSRLVHLVHLAPIAWCIGSMAVTWKAFEVTGSFHSLWVIVISGLFMPTSTTKSGGEE